MANPGPQLEDVSYENPDQQEEADKKPQQQGINKEKLTPREKNALENGTTSIPKLLSERAQHKQAAKAEIDSLRDVSTSKEVVDLTEYKELNKELESLEQEIEETESPEKMKGILDKIRDIPRKREKEKANKQKTEKKESEKLDIDSPELVDLRQEFNQICNDNKHLIGEKELPGFKQWFKMELQKNPTIKNGKEITEKLKGEKVYDKGGLAPRREVYRELTDLFQKHKLGSPQKSPYIKHEGLSERKEFLAMAKSAKSEIDTVNDNLWSKKAKDKTMQEVLLAKNPSEQAKLTQKIKDIKKIESEGFTYMKNTMNVGGTSIRKMSDASIQAYLKDLKGEGSIAKRMDYITGFGKYTNGIKQAVENEGSLAGKEVNAETAKLFGIKKGLEGIYKDNPEGLKIALKSFEVLDFMSKIKSLKEHQHLVDTAESQETMEKKLTVKAAHAKIDEAARKKHIAANTQKKYKEWFEKEDNYKDPTTKKPGDLKVLQKYFDILTNEKPDGKARNLKAYEVKRDRFKNEVKELKNIDPDIDKDQLKEWQDKYDKEGWTERKKVFKDLKKAQTKLTEDKKKEKEAMLKAEISDEDKDKEKLNNLSKNEAIQASIRLINEDQASEALKKLIAYNDKDPDDPDIIFWMEVAMKRIKEFGSGKKTEDNTEKQIEEEIKKVATSDESIKDDLEEENLERLNIQGVEMSEHRHGEKASAQARAKDESMDATEHDSLEAELTEDFYEQTDSEHILDAEGSGEEMTEVKFDDAEYTGEEIQSLKERTRENESRLFNKEGFTHIKLKDKSGREIKSDEAKEQQSKDLEDLTERIAEQAEDNIAAKEGKKGSVFDLNARIAAKRKAKEFVEQDTTSHERLRT